MIKKDSNIKGSEEFSKMSINWDIGQYVKHVQSLINKGIVQNKLLHI